MNKTVRNERRKLTASWLNTIATALMAAGVFAPAASQIFGFGPSRVDQTLVLISSTVCVVLSPVDAPAYEWREPVGIAAPTLGPTPTRTDELGLNLRVRWTCWGLGLVALG